jgi:GNAT superfamily N-acetyltransferase
MSRPDEPAPAASPDLSPDRGGVSASARTAPEDRALPAQFDGDLVVETDPDRRDIQTLEDRIYEFNAKRTACDDGELVAIFVRGQDGTIRAGLYGWTWSGCLEIRYLWVEEGLRGQGIGSRLLDTGEATGRARGCHLARVGTHSFQAPGFYQRHGYEVYATLDGYPTGHQHLSLKKSLLGG